jgi:O-antigen/teichoic acid export membrane protein
MSLARRSITSISWNFAANTAVVVILAVRMVLLTRWLTPEIFGTYALAYAIIILTAILPNFGMAQAFIHRAPQMENEDNAAAVHFTLLLLFTTIWVVILLGGAYLFAGNELQLALFVIVPIFFGLRLTQTPGLILRRRVEHRRLAIANFTDVVLTTAVALPLAWNGAGLWALLATDIVSLVVRVFYLYIWRPVWKPRLCWDEALVRYYLQFGSRAFVADALEKAIDRIDDLWAGVFLGQNSLGIYSRAYAFATYPRKLLAAPVHAVAGGTYAELKGDRLRLSQSFFRINAFLVRSGFLFAGVLALIAPELVLLLGEQWHAMLTPFRLMLLFVLLDPIKTTVGLLFVAVGQPQRLAWSRAVQLSVLLIGLFLLGTIWGINGVALAVDIMLLVGIAIMLWQSRRFVDFSIWRLFAVPLLAFGLGMGVTLAIITAVAVQSPWLAAFIKLLIFTAVYLAIWLLLEWQDALRMLQTVRGVFTK